MSAQTVIRDWALRQVGAPYVYGATGQTCTPGYREARCRQYPQHAPAIRQYCPVLRGDSAGCQGCRHAGRPCYDCAQLTRAALALAGLSLPSGASSQWLSGGWLSKGPVEAAAGQTLCLLFRAGGDEARPMRHVGLSLGDGRVVDARSHRQGVVLSRIGDYPWTHWALPGGLDGAMPPLKPGDRGERVRQLQRLLMLNGQALPRYGADGAFGGETLAALHGYLASRQLALRDSADEALLARLSGPPAPAGEDRLKLIERRLELIEVRLFGGKR